MKKKESVRTMDIILAVIAVFLFSFIAVLLWLYYRTGAIPDTLCTCVFAACGGECGVMGWIKTTKDRQREHKWEQEEKQAERSVEKESEENANE